MDIINVYRSKKRSCSISLAGGLFALFLSFSSTTASNGYKLSIINYENEIDLEVTVTGHNFDSWHLDNWLSDMSFNNQAVDTANWNLTGIFGRQFLKEFMDDLVPDGYELYNFCNTNAHSGHGVASELSRQLYVKNLYENGSISPLDEDIVIRWKNGIGHYQWSRLPYFSFRITETHWEKKQASVCENPDSIRTQYKTSMHSSPSIRPKYRGR